MSSESICEKLKKEGKCSGLCDTRRCKEFREYITKLLEELKIK